MDLHDAGPALIACPSFDDAVPVFRTMVELGYVSTLATSIEDALVAVSEATYSVVLVDETLMDQCGLEVVQQLQRASGDVPVVVVAPASGRRAVGQAVGSIFAAPLPVDPEPGLVEWGPLRMDMDRRMAWWRDDRLGLTPKQFRLLY